MAMNAKQAAELINNGKFDNADELYEALNGSKEYAKEFETLLKHIENKVKLDMNLYAGLANSAKSVDKFSDDIDPLNKEDPYFADIREKLSKVELSQTVEEKGKTVVKPVEGEERDKMIAQLVAAAKLEANSELRGASSPESPDAKKFMNASEDEKKAIYRETLNEKIDLAILQSFLVTEEQKINKEMSEKYAKDDKKAAEEAKILLSARSREIKEKIANLGKSTAEKLQLSADGVVGYCAQAAVHAEDRLSEYKKNIKKVADRINQGFAKLKDKSKDLRNQWQAARPNINKVFESCNKKMAAGITAFNDGCKHVWANKYTIAKNVARSLADKKYEIGADIVAAAGFSLTVASGGTAALVGGAAYAAYTIGRRVVYEAYKQKKENPDKSYKQIYSNGKFITKAVFSCAAAAVSYGIASTAASAGADVATQTAAEVGKQLAAQKILRRGLTVMGGVTSNAVGVATAQTSEERKKEWKSLGLSALSGAVAMLVAESCSSAHADENVSHLDKGNGLAPITSAEKADSLATHVEKTDSIVAPTEKTDTTTVRFPVNNNDSTIENNGTEAVVAGADDLVMKEFPEQWNAEMGISRRQFETLKGWYDKLDTNDGAGMDRFYSHAAHYAATLSVDAENPMTAEQVLFKFSRLAAITSVRNGEFGTIGTGSLGEQMENLYHLLGCGDQLTLEQMEEAKRTLDICTLNEAGRADGRMDAEKFFAVAGAGYKGLPVDEDGTLSMTRNIRVIGEGTNCPEDKRVMYEDVIVKEEKVVEEVPEIEEEPQKLNAPVPPKLVIEPKSGLDVKMTIPEKIEVPVQPVAAPKDELTYVGGALTQAGERPGYEGAQALKNMTKDSPYANPTSRRKARLLKKMFDEVNGKGM